RYNWQQAMEIIIPAAKALDFAHKNNIIHGNLRPSNILFDAEETVKLTDFGLPPHYQGSSLKNWYGPPEKRKSRAGDLYSLGVILFQMLTGRIPSYDNRGNLDFGEDRQHLPEGMQHILNRLAAIRVARRYQTCGEFLEGWDAFQEEQAMARVIQPSQPPAEIGQRRRLRTYVLVAAAVLLLIAVVLFVTGQLG
ncbi:MAG: protein kinase, partial [Candidatus Zixiibacteriota bacterium]